MTALGERPRGRPRRAGGASVVAVAFAAALALGSTAARADGGATDALMSLTTWPAVLGISSGVIALAFLMNRFAAKKRRHLRRTATAGLVYLASLAARLALLTAGFPRLAHTAQEAGEVFALLTAVNMAGLLLFDLALPAIRVEVAPITADLAVALGNVVAVLVSMSQFGVDFSGIVTTSALVTTIIAFSLQSTLSNVMGGVALQLDHSIHVGDWLQLESGRQGRVREIRWRYTVLETRDWDTLIVPNASLLASTIVVLGKREAQPVQHRMWVYFNVDFRFGPAQVICAVESAIQAAPIEGVATEPAPNCICFDFSRDGKESFGYYAVRYWLTDLARDDPTSSVVRQRIHSALKRAGIPLAMPAAHVWVETDDAQALERKRARDLEERLRSLATIELMKPLRQEERVHIAAGLRYAPFAPGETITRQGAVAHWLYVLASGSVEIRVEFEGTTKVVATVHAPGFFGEMGLMTGAPRSATVVALDEVECYRLDKATFDTILTERPELAKELAALLASRLVGLHAVRDDIDAETKQRRIEAEGRRILGTLRHFFGLSDEREGG